MRDAKNRKGKNNYLLRPLGNGILQTGFCQGCVSTTQFQRVQFVSYVLTLQIAISRHVNNR